MAVREIGAVVSYREGFVDSILLRTRTPTLELAQQFLKKLQL